MSALDDQPAPRPPLNKLTTILGAPNPETASQAMPSVASQTESGSAQGQATLLVRYVADNFELFHDDNQISYCRDGVTGEVFAIQGREFRDRLQAMFYQANRQSVRDTALREALGTLNGLARFQGMRATVNLRTAVSPDGYYYLDLAIPGGSQAVRWGPGCWEIVGSPVPMFYRTESMQPLPQPVSGHSVESLWRLVNIPEDARLLVLTWLIDSLRPDTPYPVLELIGEQGTAKSATQNILRDLLDPNLCNLRGSPRSVDDIYVAAKIGALLSYENVSHLSPSMQDALCVVATGGGYGKRRLYSDYDESVVTAKRPIVLNGISASITAQDLVDRAINIELPLIVERREIHAISREFAEARPLLLGAILDIAAKALEILPQMQLPPERRPRLLEFAYLGMAVAQTVGEPPETFMQQFCAIRRDSVRRTIDADPVASAIHDLVSDRPDGFVGSAKDCLRLLEQYRPAGGDWPRSPKGLGDAMRRAAPALRQLNIHCTSLGKGSGGVVRWVVKTKQ